MLRLPQMTFPRVLNSKFSGGIPPDPPKKRPPALGLKCMTKLRMLAPPLGPNKESYVCADKLRLCCSRIDLDGYYYKFEREIDTINSPDEEVNYFEVNEGTTVYHRLSVP